MNELIDQGWQEMSGLLDREMPQHRRRRWLAWVLWGVAFLIVTSAALFAIDRLSAPKSDPVPTGAEPMQHQADLIDEDQRDLASIATEATNEAAEEAVDVQIEDGGKEAAQQDDREPLSADVTQDNQQSGPETQSLSGAKQDLGSKMEGAVGKTPDVEEASRILPGTKSQEITEQAKVSQSEEERVLAEEKASRLPEQDVAAAETIVDQPVEETPERRALLSIPGQLHGVTQSLDLAVRGYPEPVEMRIPYKSKFALYGLAASHYDEVIQMHGLEGGLAVSYEVGRRVRVMTGLTYGHYANRGLLRITSGKRFDEFAAPDGQEMDTMPGGGINAQGIIFANRIYNNTVAYDTARILTDRFNYLHLPVMVQFRLSSRLDIGTGIRISRLLSAPSEYAINNQAISFNAANVSLDAQGPNNFLYNYDIVRKFDFAPSVGLSWRVGRLTTVDVYYQRGFVPYIDRSGVFNRTDFHKSLSVGLRFQIL